jgi:hypothetical protein
MVEVRAGKAAELLCVGLREVVELKAVSAGKVVAGLLSPGTPEIRRATSTVTPSCHTRQ